MLVRRLDDAHDMTFGYGLGCIAERSEACAQNVKTRLLLLQGEWFLDLNAGVPWLQKILIKPARVLLANTIIRRRIATTPDVAEIVSYESNFASESRKLTVSVTVRTVYGDVVDIKVSK
ncbi:hypothetical protein [Hydrogenophaga pseudoflava]|uniref:hypothetical protein n=1 Tax=Hydrogenophaga pseudoflava TaxID=47421 RepID=UPI0027E5B35B|nr:hypothetical protein [Hydrogenophaga pseudoflava]MDQ7745455.1 hypothetical protein [Hydrogenophaga pseudoflava]